MAVSEMNHMGHDVFFPRSDRNIKGVCVPRGQWHKLELERVHRVFELPEFVPYSRSTTKNRTPGPYSSLSALEQIEELMVRVVRSHFGSRAISVQVSIVAVSDHVFHRFPFDLLIQVSATQLSLFLCIPFVLMATDRV